MQFEAIPMRKNGKLLPHHLRWSGAVRGDLYVKEEHDEELNRVIKKATIVDPSGHKVLLKPLHDVVLISVKPDWWTMPMSTTWSPRRTNETEASP
jgi:hypothetical protein